MKLFLLVAVVMAAFSVPAVSQQQQFGVLGDPVGTKVRIGDSYRMYYSWDIGFCYLTAVDSIGMKRAWVTVAHLFAQSSCVSLEYQNEEGEQKIWYLKVIRYLGHDLCQVDFSHDSVYTKIDLPWPGSGADTSKIFFTALVKNEYVYSLVDRKKYQIIAIFNMVTGEGKIEGFVIDRECHPGDCGSGFIRYHKDKSQLMTIRGMRTDQAIFEPLRDRVRGISECALVVPVKHQGAPSTPKK
ncbi:MAG: hypothetical protein Q8O59_03005 [bacterium]|nr:hypothetical protein [bacterium]